MFGRRRRLERRLRERGHPARATILSATPDGDDVDASGRLCWALRLHVVTGTGEMFDADADGLCPVGDFPAIGAEVDVLHDPGNRRRVVLNGPMPTGMSPTVDRPETPPAGHEGDAPDALSIVRDVLNSLQAGPSAQRPGTADAVEVRVDGRPVDVDMSTPPAPRPAMSRAEMTLLAQTDPAQLAQVLLGQIANGQLPIRDAIVMGKTLELDNDTARRVIAGLRGSGSLSPEAIDAIRRAARDA